MIDTAKRTTKTEIMDAFDFQGEELIAVLKHIDQINARLGGHRVTINGIKTLLKKSPNKTICIADVGCGSGASLRAVAAWAKTKNIAVKLIGIDANAHIIKVAQSLTPPDLPITYQCLDVFSAEFKQQNFDIVISSLTFHHFKDEFIIKLLQQLEHQVSQGIVINDLHRHSLSYRLFQLYSSVFVNSNIAKQDGLISILRGFKSRDFKYFTKHLKSPTKTTWFWAFRFQFLIQK